MFDTSEYDKELLNLIPENVWRSTIEIGTLRTNALGYRPHPWTTHFALCRLSETSNLRRRENHGEDQWLKSKN